VLVAALAAGILAAAGCTGAAAQRAAADAGQSGVTRDFEKYYKQYSARFWERVSAPNSNLQSQADVFTMAAKTWDEVFGPHKDVVAARVKELLGDLEKAAPVQEEPLEEVAKYAGAPDQFAGQPPKQLLWNPVSAASFFLNNVMLPRLFKPEQMAVRNFLLGNATLYWEAVNTSFDEPKLQLRQGPWVFTADLVRKNDYYEVKELRWLAPKGSIKIQQGATDTSGTGGTMTPSDTAAPAPRPTGRP
jgi:hypothetical protein